MDGKDLATGDETHDGRGEGVGVLPGDADGAALGDGDGVGGVGVEEEVGVGGDAVVDRYTVIPAAVSHKP